MTTETFPLLVCTTNLLHPIRPSLQTPHPLSHLYKGFWRTPKFIHAEEGYSKGNPFPIHCQLLKSIFTTWQQQERAKDYTTTKWVWERAERERERDTVKTLFVHCSLRQYIMGGSKLQYCIGHFSSQTLVSTEWQWNYIRGVHISRFDCICQKCHAMLRVFHMGQL